MKTFEEVFKALGCDKPFRDKAIIMSDGFVDGLTEDGNKAYGKLIAILDFLSEQDLIEYDVNKLDRTIDEVSIEDINIYSVNTYAINKIKHELEAISIPYNDEDIIDLYNYYMEFGYEDEKAISRTVDEIVDEFYKNNMEE